MTKRQKRREYIKWIVNLSYTVAVGSWIEEFGVISDLLLDISLTPQIFV